MKRAITKTETEKTIGLRVPSSTIKKTKKLNEMKTKNNVQKTKNNVQKTVSRSLAVVVSFVLISFTVTAQDFWKTVLTNSSFNQIALAMVETSKKSNFPAPAPETIPATTIYENEYDARLVVEDWMTDNDYFKPTAIQHVEKEYALQLEEWMFDESLFNVADDTDGQLKVEAWMTSDEVWN